VQFYVNGELFTDYNILRHVKTVEGLGEVYGTSKRNFNSYVNILHNGLFMFSRYITDLNRSVNVEVFGRSVDVFTQNRDGFKGTAGVLFDIFISELTIDKESFVKPKPRKFVLEGAATFINFINRRFDVSPALKAALDSVRVITGDTFDSTALAGLGTGKCPGDRGRQSNGREHCHVHS
jgi:hypothetical protein